MQHLTHPFTSTVLIALILTANVVQGKEAAKDVPVVFTGRMLVAVKPAQAKQIERSGASRAGADDWKFERIAALPTARGKKPPTREWIVASPPAASRGKPPKGNPWDLAHGMVDGKVMMPIEECWAR